MVEFDIKGCSRKCAKTEKDIGPGQYYFSVLLHDDDELVRQDFLEEAWDGPPEDCVGWWKSQVPDLEDGRVYWAPNDVIFAYFDEIRNEGKDADKLYVMALLMVRRRLMKLEDNSDNRKIMRFSSPRHDTMIEIPVAKLTSERVAALQNDLGEHLFTNRVVGESDESPS